ncbi:unnamed protein product [Periconia digitata]|uniref:Enoyl reductase (ER) domain-containing protein n=1 Tax=Periconia digitata TaxID=1303443 RepID=A0A9W4UUT0_9PLEO|nr:unnamed protein product [Periconia digitata]
MESTFHPPIRNSFFTLPHHQRVSFKPATFLKKHSNLHIYNMTTHRAVATVGIKAPLDIISVPTITPQADQVRIRVQWTASTPLDLHQNDGGLLVKHPQVLGDGIAGTVVEVGPDVKRLKVGEKVFGFGWRKNEEKAHQEFVTIEEWLVGVLPEGFTLQQAVTLPNNFVTVFHAVTADLGLELPWPKPNSFAPNQKDEVILVWGGASSVGQFAIQILAYYGYANIFTTASERHHEKLRAMGAKHIFDYNDADVIASISQTAQGSVPLVVDCIGSLKGSLTPLAKIATKGSKVAVLLPIIVKDSSESEDPEYAIDVETIVDWEEGVIAKGVRTHYYLENEFFKNHLQADIMPAMLEQGIVKPNAQKIIEGDTLLERAQKAMDALRRKEASMERLVWRVSEI